MVELQLTLRAARNLHLAAQGLLTRPRRQPQTTDILRTIQQMSLLQIDTINVVARSPYLVLFSRLGAYPSSRAAILRWCAIVCWRRITWAGNITKAGWMSTLPRLRP